MHLPPTLWIAAALAFLAIGPALAVEPGLVGYWKLAADYQDYSGRGLHAQAHGADLPAGEFNGRDRYVLVPHAESLAFGKGEFSISAWVFTEQQLTDVWGDLLSKYDPELRKGFHLGLSASSGGWHPIRGRRKESIGTRSSCNCA